MNGTEVGSGVYRVLRSRRIIPGSNVYFVAGEELILVDSGSFPIDARRVLENVFSLGYDPREISTLVLTHFHDDHSGGAFELKKRVGAKIAIHKADAGFLSGAEKPDLPLRIMSRLFKFVHVKPDLILEDGDRLSSLEVIHTPGHTPGSICLHDRKRKILFCGDAVRVFGGKIKRPGRLTSENPGLAFASIRNISGLDFETLLPGHGEPVRPKASLKLMKLAAATSASTDHRDKFRSWSSEKA